MRAPHFGLALAGVLAASVPAAAYQPPTCRNAYTEQQEITEGQKVAAEVYKQMPVLKDSDPIAIYVQRLGAKLVAQAPGYAWPYNFHVVSSDQINAFALPGGSIFINLATIQAAENESQLAGVMAHEISHVVMRHSTCNLTKQRTPGLFASLLGMAGQAVGGGWGSLITLGTNVGFGSVFLRMSRDSEKQADLLGTDILYDAGYDPRGMPQFFEIIQSKYGRGGAQWTSDHPNPGNRTEYVNAEIRTLPERRANVKTSTDFARVKASAAAIAPLTADQVKAGAWKSSGAYQLSAPQSATRME